MNKAMSGACAVGIVIVDGPVGSAAQFTPAERADVILGFSHGWDRLYSLAAKFAPAPSHLLLLPEVTFVELALDPTTIPAPTSAHPGASDYSTRETPWRDAALTAMGYRTGLAGIAAHNQHLLKKTWAVDVTATSAYVAFVTKYRTAWMGYTNAHDAYMVIQHQWVSRAGDLEVSGAPGWGVDWPNVVAHETGHIFGAPDEYAPCSSTSHWGVLGAANGNCEVSPIGGTSVPCLMAHNTLDACAYTQQHFGWVDADANGVLDVTP